MFGNGLTTCHVDYSPIRKELISGFSCTIQPHNFITSLLYLLLYFPCPPGGKSRINYNIGVLAKKCQLPITETSVGSIKECFMGMGMVMGNCMKSRHALQGKDMEQKCYQNKETNP